MLALLLAGALAGTAAARTHRYAVVVGNNEGGPESGWLYFAEQDADRVAQVLVELGGFPASQVTVLHGARRTALLRELEQLAERVRTQPREPGDDVLVLLYYSGHGTPEGLELGRTTVSHEELDLYLSAAAADVELLLIDSCHAGAMTRTKGARDKGGARAPSFLVELDPGGSARGRVVIGSSAADELSQESDEIGGSYFTHFLVSGLRGAADADSDGRVTLGELYAHLYRETAWQTAATRAGVQHPTYDFDLTGTGDLVLSDTQPSGGTLQFDGSAAGRYLVFDERRREFVAELQVAAGLPRRLALPAGTYRVQRRGADALEEEVVQVRAGEVTSLDPDGLAQVAYADDVTKGVVVRQKRLVHGPRLELGGRVGFQAFWDDTTRDLLVPPVALLGVTVAVDRLASVKGLRLFADVSGGGREQLLDFGHEQIPSRFRQLSFGAGLTVGPPHDVLRLYVGPRLGALYLFRSFQDAAQQPPQDLFTFLPGLVVGVGVRLDGALGIVAEGRLNYLYMDAGDVNMSVGNTEVYLLVDVAL
jgi:hypothetical protein